MSTSVYECNEKADRAIAAMVATVVGTAAVPAAVNWALTASAMGAGAAAIGKCYGFNLTKNEGWKLVKQFVLGAGAWFLAMNVSSKIFTALIQSTGIGYGVGVALDAVTSAAFAWAIGATSKEYFQREYLGKSRLSNKELGIIFREAFKDYKNK